MKVNELNARLGRRSHPLEAQATGCTKDFQTSNSFDPRYVKAAGFSISEYDLYASNGILPKLKSIPGYNDTYYNDKKQTMYEIYTRPTLQWSLKCDKEVMTRKEAATLLAFDFTDEVTASDLSFSKIK